MKDKNYFGICPEDGFTEWIDLKEENTEDETGQINYLKEDGSIAFPNKYIRLKKKKYLDIICRLCECPVIIIPFEVCDVEERKRVFQMSPKEKIKYSQRFELLY